MEPPSPALVELLNALGLATATDLRRSSGRARQLARGLPVTDGVWIDALRLAGKLTLFQSKLIEANHGGDLVLARKFVLRNPVQVDATLSVYEAVTPGRREPFLISSMSCESEVGDAAILRMLKTVNSLAALRDQIPSLPIDSVLERGRLHVMSNMQAGKSLDRLLVRRGRFPESVVLSIATELVKQLAVAEPLAIHGDLRVGNVWLTDHGNVGLLNWGMLNAVSPEITIHSRFPLGTFDGMAPERLEAGHLATTSSEVYAFGCLLWQLLTGRPPFTVADPLAKMMSHRSRSVPDVRTLAPSVSESLSKLIRSLTSRDPHRRPQSWSEVAQMLGGGARWTKPRLMRFAQQFESAAPRNVSEAKPKSKITSLAATLLITAVLAGVAWNRDRLGLMSLSRVGAATASNSEGQSPPLSNEKLTSDVALNESATSSPSSSAESVLEAWNVLNEVKPAVVETLSKYAELPAPDQNGVVTLRSGEIYSASELIAGEVLNLLVDGEKPSVIRIHETSLVLEADHVRLDNIRIECEPSSNTAPLASPIQLRSETLTLNRCVLKGTENAQPQSYLSWTLPGGATAKAARMLAKDSILLGSGPRFELNFPLSGAKFENVLIIGSGEVLKLKSGVTAGLRAPVIFNECTLRDCGPVVSMPATNVMKESGVCSVQGQDSVIALQQGTPIFGFSEGVRKLDWQSSIEIAAQGLVVEVGGTLAGEFTADQRAPYAELASDTLRVDGLLSGDFHFVGEADGSLKSQTVVIDHLPVRVSDRLPGAVQARLPAID
ncbi:serine/threonine protein kinase [Planctomicrobium sp. SH668]|uniref:serine/threonine protein kinase n=1 Tax=Planctomicrobium sp. SH668 TaxID=3448126 RepID=UPI003F5C2E7F